jgi:hypothetical protein
MDAATREQVRRRASGRCEYCHFPDHASDLPFHVEHIVASSHGGDDSFANLAWACARCNLRKGPNLATIDPDGRTQVVLYNPRTMPWDEHFEIRDGWVGGVSAVGRGTVRLLDMNHPRRLAHRKELMERGEF